MSKRQMIVNTAASYIGCNEADGSHKKIIDLYNSHKPLARSYRVKYTDNWCATFVSAVAIKCDMTDIMPTECGCQKMIALYKNLGRWVENDAYIPKPGDIVMYDWQDNGKGDCTGYADHVGIVESVNGKSMRIIEGNRSDRVKYVSLQVNGRYIRGYCVPNYEGGNASTDDKPAESASAGTAPAANQLTVDGKWGTATTKRLQEIFGTPVDGIVSNQWASYKSKNSGLVSGFDWDAKPNGKGSSLIKAMQKWAGMSTGSQDGEIGPATIKALQKKLGTPVDGVVSNPSAMVKALQKWANNQ